MRIVGVTRMIAQAVAWAVIASAALAILVAVLIPRLAGATPYSVLTGSMRPTYPPGTLVIVKPVPFEDLRTGEVITYQLESGKPAVATHRVVASSVNLKGELRLTTQGDANSVPDELPVGEEQVRGRLWYSVPYLGYVNQALTGAQRQTATYVVAGALLVYAAYMFIPSTRRRVSKEVAA